MPKVIYGVSPTSVVLRAKLMDSTATDGRGLTGLSFSATGLTISVIQNNAASGTHYTAAAGTIETIATFGTYAAPTPTKCRFREVDSTYHKGLYEFQFADSIFSATDSVIISIAGATQLAEADFEIQCKNLNANLKSIDEQATNGNNATLNLKQLNIQNGTGNPVFINSTGSNTAVMITATTQPAINAISSGGSGVVISGYSAGIECIGTYLAGIYAHGTTGAYFAGSTAGMTLEGASSGNGLAITGGTSSGHAIALFSHENGIEIEVDGNGIKMISNGNGIDISSPAGYGINSSGLYAGAKFEGTGGSGIIIAANGTGNGITVGSVSGDGANIRSDYGMGMRLVGSNENGLLITGYNYGAKIEATNPGSGIALYAIGTYLGGLIEGGTNGLNCYSSGYGYGIYSSGEIAGAKFEGLTDGSGIIITGNGIGNGLTVGSLSGDGANIRSDYGIGMRLVGDTKDISTREIDAIEIKTGQMQFSADGVNIYDIMSNVLAMANGRFVKSGSDITFYRQNNSTPAFTVNVTTSERTRT